jgi:hypothetical protein
MDHDVELRRMSAGAFHRIEISRDQAAGSKSWRAAEIMEQAAVNAIALLKTSS